MSTNLQSGEDSGAKQGGESKTEIPDESEGTWVATGAESSKGTGKRASTGRRMSGSGSAPPSAANRLRLYKSNSRSKWVTREIAALEFLLGVPLESEREIVQRGWMQQQGIVQDRSKATKEEDDEEKVEILEPPSNHAISTLSSHIPNNQTLQGRWWEKWINNPKQSGVDFISRRSRVEEDDLERPNDFGGSRPSARDHTEGPILHEGQHSSQPIAVPVHAPGRRLQGDEATKIQIPISEDATIITRQKNIARLASTREWEVKVAHGIGDISNNRPTNKASILSQKQVRPPMLDSRLFFSAGESYPMQVFSLLRYEPKKEEAARRRQKLEARGGGGTQFFIMPVRDWRGISYRALLPARKNKSHGPRSTDPFHRFDRFVSSSPDSPESRSKTIVNNNEVDRSGEHDLDEHDDDSVGSGDDEEDTYVVGLLDDPEMVQGRHRNVMIGDRVTGPIVLSTIQFVKPQFLKADLNKQFRERFEGWEPPKSQRKYIGARVVDGLYTLMDPGIVTDDATIGTTEEDSHLTQAVGTITTNTTANTSVTPRKRQGSISSMSTGGEAKENIRMPPSLTLSKIRSLKHQALSAAVTAKLEISTVALSIVYFERLCLDCRVDKTNRRLSFAACLLLALKMNEAHVELVMTKTNDENLKSSTANRIQSLIRPAKKSGNVFASLLEFFTQEWNLSLKHLFAAEWGVFAALQFRLHAKPSQVAFHFKRLLKVMDWNPRAYLGPQMYSYWVGALSEEEYQRIQREERREARKQRKEHKKLLQLKRELAAVNRTEVDSSASRLDIGDQHEDSDRRDERTKVHSNVEELSPIASPKKGNNRQTLRPAGIGRILNHFAGGRKTLSSDRLSSNNEKLEANAQPASKLQNSPSMPAFPTSTDISGDSNVSIGIPRSDGAAEASSGDHMKPGNDNQAGITV